MQKQWLRLALVGEFFLAVTAIWASWRGALGDYHLDNLPWHIKLPLVLGLAFSLVMLTRASLQAPARSKSTGSWLVLALLLLLLMAGASAEYIPVEEETETESQSVPLSGTKLTGPLPVRSASYQIPLGVYTFPG